LVVVARSRYYVPCVSAGQRVNIRLYPGKMVIVMDDAVVASHERPSERGQTHCNWEHYIPVIQRKPGGPRNGTPFDSSAAIALPVQFRLCRLNRRGRIARLRDVVPLQTVAVGFKSSLSNAAQANQSFEA